MPVTKSVLATLALATTLAACASNPAPRRWLAPAREAQSDPYGAWIVLRGGQKTVLTSGELLAVEDDSVFVLDANGRVAAVARAAVPSATIAFYDGQFGRTAAWAGVGALSSISHGFGLILSGPIWILSGSLAARADSRAPLITVKEPAQWVGARAYARFPGGLPAGLPRVLPVKPRRQP